MAAFQRLWMKIIILIIIYLVNDDTTETMKATLGLLLIKKFLLKLG